MDALARMLATDPSRPRLTVYVDNGPAPTRMEFSATSLDNWASKIANWLCEEFSDPTNLAIAVATPPSWQALAAILGIWRAGAYIFDPLAEPDNADLPLPDAVLTSGFILTADSRLSPAMDGDIAFVREARDTTPLLVLSDDPWGRSLDSIGIALPDIDGFDLIQEARLTADTYMGPTPPADRTMLVSHQPISAADFLSQAHTRAHSLVVTTEIPTHTPGKAIDGTLLHELPRPRVLLSEWASMADLLTSLVAIWQTDGSAIIAIDADQRWSTTPPTAAHTARVAAIAASEKALIALR